MKAEQNISNRKKINNTDLNENTKQQLYMSLRCAA